MELAQPNCPERCTTATSVSPCHRLILPGCLNKSHASWAPVKKILTTLRLKSMEKRCLEIICLGNPLELYRQLHAPMVYSKKQRQPTFSNYLKRNLQEPQRV